MNTLYKADTLRINIQIKDDNRAPVNLAGTSQVALIGRSGTSLSVPGTVTVVDQNQGEIQIEFAPNSVEVGSAEVQLRLLKDGEWQTVYQGNFKVLRSLVAG